ncbi:hypothetical protein LQF12_03110 [Ruania suaedae]|uniref:hypothetical protein n=1 Tax=Ruania suaedae TaxID=2897774 RepID=UPI001E3CC495|nr:hypothetical protein [Ruania suaedae]UFU03614.1 hypothetical protein LQF12_03110 [Ruania suaedae]
MPSPSKQLAPAKVNAKVLFVVGSLAWAVMLATLGVLHLAGASPDGRLAWVAVAGLALGTCGYGWAHRIHLIDDEGMAE